MSIDSDDDLHALRRVGQLVGAALAAMEAAAEPGLTTGDLDDIGASVLKVLTIEPIISERPCRAVDDRDGWTIRTSNGSLSAHYEETIVITSGAPIVLTALPA